jgi:hypothetical protein
MNVKPSLPNEMTPKLLVSSNFIFITGKIKIKNSRRRDFGGFLAQVKKESKTCKILIFHFHFVAKKHR